MSEALPAEVDVLVVGAGQAGLGAAHWLTRDTSLRVVVVDRAPVGQSWEDTGWRRRCGLAWRCAG